MDGPGEAALGIITVRRESAEQRRARPEHRCGDGAAQRWAEWSRIQLGLARFIEEARSFRGLMAGPAPGGGATMLERNERAFLALSETHVIEPQPTGGRFVGGSGGVWLRMAGGGRCQVGATGGLFVPGLDQPESVDVGGLVVTDRRVIVSGGLRHHEWPFPTLAALHHDPDAPWTALVMSDRPEVTGVFYGHADVPFVRFRLMLALAVHTGSVGRLRMELEAELRRHLDRQPPRPCA